MIAININWTEAPFEGCGWMVAKSETELKGYWKDYHVTITGIGEELGDGLRIYDFKLREKDVNKNG